YADVEVDVIVALFLACDLRLGDLAEELDGAVRDLRRLEPDRLHSALEVEDVVQQLLPELLRAGRSAHPEELLERVEARPLRLPDVTGAGVDRRIEVAEALGHGLDPLVRDAGVGVRGLGARDVPDLQPPDE